MGQSISRRFIFWHKKDENFPGIMLLFRIPPVNRLTVDTSANYILELRNPSRSFTLFPCRIKNKIMFTCSYSMQNKRDPILKNFEFYFCTKERWHRGDHPLGEHRFPLQGKWRLLFCWTTTGFRFKSSLVVSHFDTLSYFFYFCVWIEISVLVY